MPISIQVTGARELQKALAEAPKTLERRVGVTMARSVLRIERAAKQNLAQRGRTDTRRLMNSITSTVQGGLHAPGGLVGKIGPSVRYGLYVHQGRRPGGRMPPIRAIEGWARRHGIEPFLVARSIAQNGIEPAPFMAEAFEEWEEDIIEDFERTHGEWVKTLGG
jgi:hypothetical protein